MSNRSVIGRSIAIEGDVGGREDITIFGHVKGRVEFPDNAITVGNTGQVQADILGSIVHIEGKVSGNITGTKEVVLRATGNVDGNINTPKLALEDGATLCGRVDMQKPADRQASAAPSKAPVASKASAAS